MIFLFRFCFLSCLFCEIIFAQNQEPETTKNEQSLSGWMSEERLIQKITYAHNVPHFQSVWVEDTLVEFLVTWDISITIEDGSVFSRSFDYRSPSWISGSYQDSWGNTRQHLANCPYGRELQFVAPYTHLSGIDHDLYSENDVIAIIEEKPGDINMQAENKSYFLIRNLTKNKEFTLIGETRLIP